MNDTAEEAVFATMDDYKRYLATVLMGLGATKAHVEYDGSGDSGAIQGIGAVDAMGANINIDGVEVRTYGGGTSPLADALEGLADDCLNSNNIDWYNNDGGFGEYEIDLTVSPFTFTLKHNVRITDTNYEEYSDFNQPPEVQP
jgi:hypothetical protein